MTVREKKAKIVDFIINNLDKYPKSIVSETAKKFELTRQAIFKYVNQLIDEGILQKEGKTRGTTYSLVTHTFEHIMDVTPGLSEDLIWREIVLPHLPKLKENVLDICFYGFTEILNNVKDHSGSANVVIEIKHDAKNIEFNVLDKGIGIFRKIQEYLGLEFKRDAVLELVKGKFTSDPENHSGEGIFFTSRMMDEFQILSDEIFFSAHIDNDWIIEDKEKTRGTHVYMLIKRTSNITMEKIFKEYEGEEELSFSKTHFPLKLLEHEGGKLVSRSQAKRLVARFGQFKKIVLDFRGIVSIGQAFADQLFRIYQREHPEKELISIHTNKAINAMIRHVLNRNYSHN